MEAIVRKKEERLKGKPCSAYIAVEFLSAQMRFPAPISTWLKQKCISPFEFQLDTWEAMAQGQSGILNAPTGSGKTYALWIGAIMSQWKDIYPKNTQKGIKILWITPLRSLSKDTQKALQNSCDEIGLNWRVELRNGDTTSTDRARQKRNPPDCLIITPESLHILISQKDNGQLFAHCAIAIVDEWHDLLGSKRGVQTELALAHLRKIRQKGNHPELMTWGISATIPNLEEAAKVLLGKPFFSDAKQGIIIKAEVKKSLQVETLFPADIDRFPWGGRMGLPMLQEVLAVIEQSHSTLVFTNTRAQTEVWYQNILLYGNDLAGNAAVHHSSLDLEVRRWVEDALKADKLKVVVCTSSLDLGVDFAPVETIIQIGSPKDVSRILQRAGRSGHGPGRTSKVFFVPTHSLELVDASAIQYAIANQLLEAKKPILQPLDVLIQWLVTLAVGEGFEPEQTKETVRSTYAYHQLSDEEWDWVLFFITQGGASFGAYDDFTKVTMVNDRYRVENKKIALRHRLSIGTIVSSISLRVKFIGGGYLGTVEESFFTRMRPGDVFWFGGRALEVVKITAMEVLVKKATKGKGSIPSWGGGRMSLSTTFSDLIRMKMNQLALQQNLDKELQELGPLVEIQTNWSAIPKEDEFLVEYFKTRDGWHLCFYPFEGRYINEILASLVAFRIARTMPISFSIGMNDYGFELLSDLQIDPEEILGLDLFSTQYLESDIKHSINEAEMARKKFRDIAQISGMVFNGFPGQPQNNRHLQSSAELIFDTLTQYEPDSLLLKQAHDEVLDFKSENSRLIKTLDRINRQRLLLCYPPKPTPMSFPIVVDRLREKLSSESLEDRVERLTRQLESFAAGKKTGTRKMEHNRKKEGTDLNEAISARDL